MKKIPITLLQHYKKPVTSITQIFRLGLRDGSVLGFTSFDQDIILEEEPEVVYKALTGMSATATTSNSNMSVDNLDTEGYLEDDRITESDIKAGKYDYADVLIAELNWQDLPYSTAKLNIKRTGKLGQISVNNGKFVAEIRGLNQFLQNQIGELYQVTCRAYLGDSRCKVDLTEYTIPGTVEDVSNNRAILCSTLGKPAGYFNYGVIKFTSGLNKDLKFEIKNSTDKTIEFQLPANYVIAKGDTFEAIAGCDKTIKTCQDIFKNAINIRAEPYIPTTDKIVRMGG